MIYVYAYLVFCVLFGIGFFVTGIVEDLRQISTYDKFGANLIDTGTHYVCYPGKGWHYETKTRIVLNKLFWTLILLHFMPVLNLFFVYLWPAAMLHDRKMRKQHT